jgi:mRNA export factor
MRQPTPAANVQMNERVYAMDVKHPVLAVATATVPETVVERGVSRVDKKNKIMVYDLSNPQQPFRVIDSPLKFQHRCLSIFPDKSGIAVGSVEGRVAISHVQEKDLAKNFAFKVGGRTHGERGEATANKRRTGTGCFLAAG